MFGSYNVRVTEKKCATCAFWTGARKIEFSVNKPYRIKCESKSCECIASNSRKFTPGASCYKWQKWEKLN